MSQQPNEELMPKELDSTEVQTLLASDAPPALLDVREQHERDAYGWIPNSAHIPMREIPSRFEELDAARPLVVYCAGGVRSFDVGYFLRDKGFGEVISLAGGLSQWDGPVEIS